MRSIIAPLVVLLVSVLYPAAWADGPTLVITPGGYFLLSVDSAGMPTTSQIPPASVLDLRGGNPSPPPPVPPATAPPTPSPDEGLSDQVHGWATEETDPGGAAVLGMVYGQVGEAVRGGIVPPLKAPEIVRAATDKLMPGRWDRFRRRIGDEAAARLQRGELTTVEPMADFLLAISLGLKTGADDLDLPTAVSISDTINTAIGN